MKSKTEIASLWDVICVVLREVPENHSITYEELSAKCGCNIRAKNNYGVLYQARKELEKEGIFFSVIYNTGLKRIDDHAKVKMAIHETTVKARKKHERAKEIFKQINRPDELDLDTRKELVLYNAFTDISLQKLSKDNLKKIENKVKAVPALPDIDSLKSLFKK